VWSSIARVACPLVLPLIVLACTNVPDSPTARPTVQARSDAAAPPAASPPPASVAAAPPAPPAPPPAPPAPPPPPILPFDDAVVNAATMLLANAALPPAPPTLAVVIDPLIDGVTGAQSRATQLMGNRLTSLIREKYPRLDVQKFSAANVAKNPLVLIGTFTGVNGQRQTAGRREAYRICLALADLSTGKLVGKGLAFAQMEGVDNAPLAYFQDAPAWVEDPSTLGYIRTCQGTRAGDPINPAYIGRIQVATTISEAIEAYDQKRYREALGMFETAARSPDGRQLRVYNGIYLANWKLGRRDGATQAFGSLVDFGLESKKLAMSFLFRPGSTSFVADPKVSGAYPIWIREIGTRVAKSKSCLEILGNTSATGPEPVNERLSLLRAETVKTQLERQQPALRERTIANGVGSRATLVGNGRDDATDALDRRVEFKVIGC
jgi:outer membrane protein OmpA-like peptidoglycan-associated protein